MRKTARDIAVNISINCDDGDITLEGKAQDVVTMNDIILEELHNVEKLMQHEKDVSVYARTRQWMYQDEGEWKEFDKETNLVRYKLGFITYCLRTY